MTERERARPQTARARISNPVSGGQCHLNHLTILFYVILAQFSLYVHKGGLKPDSFHFHFIFAVIRISQNQCDEIYTQRGTINHLLKPNGFS